MKKWFLIFLASWVLSFFGTYVWFELYQPVYGFIPMLMGDIFWVYSLLKMLEKKLMP